MQEIDEDFTEIRMAEALEGHSTMPDGTLAELSGQPASEPPYETDLVRNVEIAWDTLLRELTCQQVRELVSQQFGLEWLGTHVAIFVRLYPQALCEYYPGDLTMAVLRAHQDLISFAPTEMTAFLSADHSWFGAAFDFDDGELFAEASRLRDEGRQFAGLPALKIWIN